MSAPIASGRPGRTASVAWMLFVLAALAAALVFWARVSSWSTCWRWSITEGREGAHIYAIWRALHGYPLYEWPNQEPYSLTFFNYAFYLSYGKLAGLFGVEGEGLLSIPRAFTVLGGVVGSALFVSTAKLFVTPRTRLEWIALGSLAFVVWFGTQFISWWSFALRPDVWATALALAGLRVSLPALERRHTGALLLAALLFFASWSFKQSCVWTFAACALSAGVVLRSVRAVLALIIPFSLLAALTFALGGDTYRFNVLVAPVASAWQLDLLFEVLARTIPQNLWVLAFFPIAFTRSLARGRSWSKRSVTERTLAIVVVVTVLMGAFALGREGSNKNHLFEGYVASALASWLALSRLVQQEDGERLRLLAVVMLVPLVVFPVAQLIFPNRLGRTQLCNGEDAREFSRVAAAIAELPKPIYVDDEIFSQPWHSTENRYPALVLDGSWYYIARREGLVPSNFPESILRAPRFRAVVTHKDHPSLDALRARGAVCHDLGGRPSRARYAACLL